MTFRSGAARVVLRLVAGAGGAEAGRSRWRRALITTLTTFGARGLAILTGLVSVPFTLRYLGTERYGVWMTISSAVALLVFADLGLGNGVVNPVSQADGANDRRHAAEVVSSAFFMLSGIALVVAMLFCAISRLIPWHAVFNVTSPVTRLELQPTIAVVFACFVVSLPFGVVQRVQIGYQEGYRNNLWEMSGSILGLGGMFVAIYCKAGLPWLVLCITGAKPVTLFCNFINQFYRVRPWLRPQWELVNWSACRKLMRVGMLFSGLTVAALVGMGTDNLVVAHFCGSAAVAQYAVIYRLSSLTMFIQYFTSPLWPAFSEAQTRGDAVWLRSAFRRTSGIAALSAIVICVTLLLLGRDLVRLWVGPAMVPSLSFLAGFCCFRLVMGLSEAALPLLSTAPLLRAQFLIGGVASIVALCSKIVAAKYAGVEGVIWATAASYGVFFSLPAMITASVWSSRFGRASARIPAVAPDALLSLQDAQKGE